MAQGSSFYREADLVKEAVIPAQEGAVVSSDAKEATLEASKKSSFPHKAVSLIGGNELIDGISVRSPAYLSDFIQRLRLRLTGTYDRVAQKLDEKSSAYYKHERKLTTTIADLHSDPREQLLPGFTYIAVAAMSGSVLTRNRNFLFRLATPLLLGSACFSYVLPNTFQNTTNLLHSIESANFPKAVAKQDAFIRRTGELSRATAMRIDSASKSIVGTVSKSQHLIKEWTGLNVE